MSPVRANPPLPMSVADADPLIAARQRWEIIPWGAGDRRRRRRRIFYGPFFVLCAFHWRWLPNFQTRRWMLVLLIIWDSGPWAGSLRGIPTIFSGAGRRCQRRRTEHWAVDSQRWRTSGHFGQPRRKVWRRRRRNRRQPLFNKFDLPSVPSSA